MWRRAYLVSACIGLLSCSEQDVAVDSSSLSEEARACLYGANAMIDVARQAVNEPGSRPERREARRELMEDWVARLEAGEDPCSVYGDINRSATTF